MNQINQLKAITLGKKGNIIFDLFGHTSKGLPGLEIIGLGNAGKIIKEKFLFISKARQLKIPAKRYVLCVESEDRREEMIQMEVEQLELPLLLLFWALADIVPIASMSDFMAFGTVSPMGVVRQEVRMLKEVLRCYEEKKQTQKMVLGQKVISLLRHEDPKSHLFFEEVMCVDLEELMGEQTPMQLLVS